MELVLQYILPSILGDYIQGLDKNHMKTNFFSGKVTLQGVSLNPGILKSLNLPTKIKYSNIGKLELKIPWVQRLKQPIEVYLEDLLVILEPNSSLDDADIVEERIKFLDALTKECRNKLRNLNQDANKEGSSMDYYKVLILDNLQVTIKNIHIRFESEQKGYSFGFTLDEVNIHTVNEKGQQEFLDRTLEDNKMLDLYKSLSIRDISFYWNAKEQASQFFGSSSYTDDQRKTFLKESILKRGVKMPGVTPILSISLESQLVLKNINKADQEKEPRYQLEIDLKPININLDNNQVNQMIALVDFITIMDRKRRRKIKLPQLSEEEKQNDSIIYQKCLAEFLLAVEEPEFTWSAILANPKKMREAEDIKEFLRRIPNEMLASTSRETILKDEKRRLLSNMEKKMNKKGWGFWSGNPDLKGGQDELQKIEGFFDSFIQENADSIGKNIMKGYLFKVSLKMSEASILLIDAKSHNQQGVLAMVKNMWLKLHVHKYEDHDKNKVEFALQDMALSLQKKSTNDKGNKEIMILNKYNPSDTENLAQLSLEMKTYFEGRSTFDVQGNARGTEFKFIPELVVTLKKFFKFDKTKQEENFADYAYEKMADLSKNAQDQIKTMISEYSSTVSISLTWDSSYVLIPLNPSKGKESDCWLVTLKGVRVFTDPENTDQDDHKAIIYNTLKYELENISVKYMEKMLYYSQHKKDPASIQDERKTFFPLMEDTKTGMELKVMRKVVKKKIEDEPEIMLTFYIGDITANLNTLLYRKMSELKNCFDFSQEKDLNDYLETEKNQILKNSDGLFKVYFRDYYELKSGWTEYIMVVSGFYLYFFRNRDDMEAARYVFTKLAKLKVERDTYDFPNILKITNKFEEVVIAFENENNLNRLVQTIEKKNQAYAEENLTVEVNEKNENGEAGSEVKAVEPANHKKILFNLKVVFEGLNLNLLEEFKRVDEVCFSKLSIEYTYRCYDQVINIKLLDISIADYFYEIEADQQPTLILSSRSDMMVSGLKSKELINIYLRFLDDRHPEFEEKMNEKEIAVVFNTLLINYVPERIYFLMNFFTKSVPKTGEEERGKDRSPGSPQKHPGQDANKGIHYIAKKAENKKEVKFLTGDIKVNELSITMYSQVTHLKIARLGLQELVVDVNVDKDASKYKGSLKNIQAFDLTNYQQTPGVTEVIPYELVGIEKGLSLLDFEFIQRDELFLKREGSSIRNILNVTINSIRINYVNQPGMRIMNYVSNFMLDFSYGDTHTYEEKVMEAIEKIKLPRFLGLNVTLNNPKIIIRAKPTSAVLFELDFELATVTNIRGENPKRVLQPSPGFESVFEETYKISTSDIILTKKIVNGESIQISRPFKLDLDFSRCLWYDDYILANGISQDDKFTTLDNTYNITGVLTPVLLKFNQEDYLDIMDAVFMNLAFDDVRDPQYHIDLTALPEMKHTNLPTPINLTLITEYLGGLAMDQTLNSLLAKIVGVSSGLKFYRNRTGDKDIEISFNKMIVNYFEQKFDTEQYVEKTLLGQSYFEKDLPVKNEDSVNEIFNPDAVAEERRDLEQDKDSMIKVIYKMFANKDRDLTLNIQQIKVILNLDVLLRLKDFFQLWGEKEENSDQIQIDLDYKSKNQYRGTIDKAEISIPVSEETTLIIKGAMMFDWVKYDITDIVLRRKDFLESSMFNFNLVKNEIFVFHEHLRYSNDSQAIQKRSIIFPFSLMYKSKEHLSYEKTNNILLAKYENTYIVDKIVLRVSSIDSMVALSAAKYLGAEFARYKKRPPFPQQSREVQLEVSMKKKQSVNLPTVTVISEKHKVVHDGMQIRVINDLSGVSIPLLDFSLHSSRENSSLTFDKSIHLLQAKNNLEISSSFYNSKVGKWEPIIEKWSFILEIDFGLYQEYKKRLDIANNKGDAFNINISDEMLKVLLLTMKDWNESFSQLNNNSTRKFSVSVAKPYTNNRIIGALLNDENANNVEYVSPFTIWNDTGYPLHVNSEIIGTHLKGISCKKKLDLQPGEQQDLLMEWNIDRIFEASTQESVLERMKVSVVLEHPIYGMVTIPNIDIHNFGTKKRKLEFRMIKKEFPIICNVFNYKKKKLVRFSSPIVIKNSLPKLVIVQIYNEDGNSFSLMEIKPQSSAALPFDKLRNYVAFHIEKVNEKSKNQIFKADSLINNAPSGITLGDHYTLLRSQLYRAYATIFLEPLIVIRNCLPFPLNLDIHGKKGSHSKSSKHTLEVQDELYLTEFSPDYKAKIKCSAESFTTNEFSILPAESRLNQRLFFYHHNKKVNLDVFTPPSKSADLTYKLIISAKVCVINESAEQLNFYACNEVATSVSPFSLMAKNGNEIVVFDSITAMKIRPKNEGSSLSDFIPLNRPGTFPIDVYDNQKQMLNLGVHITNVLSDKQNNLFTKIVLVSPRYVICNKASQIVSIYQPEAPEIDTILPPDERSAFHFTRHSKERFVKVKLHASSTDPQNWKESGVLDVSAPGNIEFICTNSSQTQQKYFNLLITIQDACLFITLQEQEPSDTSIQIKNNLEGHELIISQQGVGDSTHTIPSREKAPFAWVQPCLNNVIVAKLKSSKGETSSEIKCKLNEINKSIKETVIMGNQSMPVSYSVTLSGRSRVVEFFSGQPVEEVKDDETKFLVRVNLPSLGISLISAASNRKYELAYVSLTPFMFVAVDQNDSTSIQIRVKEIIVDNNARFDAPYPVAMFPQNLKKLRERELPCLDIICKIKNKHKNSDLLYLYDLGFYLAETCIYLDAHTLNSISDFARSINKVLKQAVYSGIQSHQYLFLSEKEKKSYFKGYSIENQEGCLSWINLDPTKNAEDFIYIEKLAIQPIIISVTFKNLQFENTDAFIFALLKNSLGKALANFDKAPIKLRGIEIRSVYGTKDQVFGTLIERYKELAKETMMSVVFSSNILGNPVKFFDRISNGFNDLVDKPVQGFLEGPIEGGIGIIAGAGSFAAKTVGATFGSLHNIADSLANGLSSLTGDDDFISKREQANTKANSNALTGSLQAVKSIGKGFLGGITGIFEKPIEGGVKDGVEGFMKGMFVGAKGLVIKPVTGVLDGVSKLTQGVSNTFDEDSTLKIIKGRMPRIFYGKERIFKPYNIYHSTLMDFLYKKKPKKYTMLTLLGAVFLDEPSTKTFNFSYCLLLTLERIFFISFQKKAIVWKMKTTNMSEVFTNERGVRIILKKPSKMIPDRVALIPVQEYDKKVEVYTLLGILMELVEETLS